MRKFNQKHGLLFENKVRSSFEFEPRHINDLYDIPAEFNNEFGTDISVKSTNNNLIWLADARRCWDNTNPLQMVVGRYQAVDSKRVFYEIITYLVPSVGFSLLRGNIPASEVHRFHDGLLRFPVGYHEQARLFAQLRNEYLEEKFGPSLIKLNPKVDSKSQRRLQCSIKMGHLSPYLVRSDTHRYRGIKLPFVLDMESDE